MEVQEWRLDHESVLGAAKEDIGGKSVQQEQYRKNRSGWASRTSRRGPKERHCSSRKEEKTCVVDQQRMS